MLSYGFTAGLMIHQIPTAMARVLPECGALIFVKNKMDIICLFVFIILCSVSTGK